jgi:hypothetical protein
MPDLVRLRPARPASDFVVLGGITHAAPRGASARACEGAYSGYCLEMKARDYAIWLRSTAAITKAVSVW